MALLNMPATLTNVRDGWAAAPAFPNLSFADPVAFVPLPKTDRVLVVERGGRIQVFENRPAVAEATLALDLSGVTQGRLDSGLLSLVFHPKFGAAGADARNFAYVQYAYSDDPAVLSDPEDTTPTFTRVSRFDVDPVSGVFDPGSELVLINQLDESLYHEGGAMLFHPRDGFLYISASDEGGVPTNNVQHIDRDLYSGILRIDVDQRGGDVSHPSVKQPQTGQTANYYIPNDNPFVGVPDALEEFYALGLRNPHRMSYDPVDDHLWIGDVGGGRREELNILERGANYGWNWQEGTYVHTPRPAQVIGTWTDPVLELPHGVSDAIIGGYVYRGTQYPELRGKYIFGDYINGTIWALPYQNAGSSVVVGELETLAQMPTTASGAGNGITSFGVDGAGELFFVNLGAEGRVWRLAPANPSSNAPARLSDTGAFADLGTQTPVAGAVPYSVNAAFWSDGATKHRWMALPEGGRVEYADSGAWRFPVGTVFIKHFSIARDERRPTELSPLETRLLVAGDGGYYGLTYRWNTAGTDATPALEREEVQLEITNAAGERELRPYVFPGPSDCLVCHTAAAGRVLGVRTEQLNRAATDADLGGTRENQIERWSEAGLFTEPVTVAPELGRLAALDDESQGVETRLRSYWAANCSFCHGTDPTLRANWDARFGTPLTEQGIIGGSLVNADAAGSGSFVVAPGDPEHSMMYQRGEATEAGFAMPPLGRRTPDERYLTLLRSWISSL